MQNARGGAHSVKHPDAKCLTERATPLAQISLENAFGVRDTHFVIRRLATTSRSHIHHFQLLEDRRPKAVEVNVF